MSNAINICIIPAAGKGSRWAPVSGYLPKEMLPLVDRPVLEWVLDEAIHSGCKEIIVIINKQKEVIREYLQKVNSINKKAKIYFIYQDEPKGLAHALSLCQEYTKNQPFAVALPDLPTISKKPVLHQLIDKYQTLKGSAHLTSFCSFPPETLLQYSECMLEARADKLLNINHFCPKNSEGKSHHPGNKLRMSGRYIFSPQIYPIIDSLLQKGDDNEIRDIDALKKAQEHGQQVLGIEILGRTYDTGTPTSYIRANTAFFKKKMM